MRRWAVVFADGGGIGHRLFWTRRAALRWALGVPSLDFEAVSMPVRVDRLPDLKDELDRIYGI